MVGHRGRNNAMRQLNYSHLQYFWAVAREGSVQKASERLHITPQTISGQLKLLEASVGQPLFDRVGRRLVLSEFGRVVFQYADEIFSIGSELASVVRGADVAGPSTLSVGIVNSMPKFVAERILAPALLGENPVRLRCHEASLEDLLGDLATHRLDLILSDQATPAGLGLRAYNHRLGENGLTFFVAHSKAQKYVGKFPESLNGAPLFLPSPQSAMRLRLDDWFESEGLSPMILGEFDDSALIKAFGRAGAGVFAGPTAIEPEITSAYSVSVIGRTDKVVERYYAISPERRVKQPAVIEIIETARNVLFATEEPEQENAGS